MDDAWPVRVQSGRCWMHRFFRWDGDGRAAHRPAIVLNYYRTLWGGMFSDRGPRFHYGRWHGVTRKEERQARASSLNSACSLDGAIGRPRFFDQSSVSVKK